MRKRKSLRPPGADGSRESGESSPSERPSESVPRSAPPSAPPSVPPSVPPIDPFGAALHAAKHAPEDEAAWDALEEQAHTLERPDDVADLYRVVLERPLPPELVTRLGQRAVRFHDEWFEDAAPLAAVLSRVVEVDREAYWAHDRLVMLYTSASRWDDLLSLYDRALESEQEKIRRMQLLDEAAHVAKDFAAQPDRAIGYLQQLFPLRPTDAQLATSLERLFERQKRHRELIDLWTSRVAVLPRDGKLAMRAKIAGAWLDKLGQPVEALASVESLLPDDPHDTYVSKLLERILISPAATEPVKRRTIAILKERYAAQKKGADVVRVLRVALETEDRGEKIAVHREITERLAELGRAEEALEHAAAVVVLDPTAIDARERLRALSTQTARHDRYAEALTAAADTKDAEGGGDEVRLSLLVEAARVRADVLGDEPEAISLYHRALTLGAARPAGSDDSTVVLDVARRLGALLENAGRAREQLDVLEQLATIEPLPMARREALGRAARLSERLGDTDRALVAWARRLGEDEADLEALDATIGILERMQNWEALIAAIRRRVAVHTDAAARRSDLVAIARVQSEHLQTNDGVEAAIETWRDIEESFGPDAETVDALADLFTLAARWQDVSALLDAAAKRENKPDRRASLLHRLGDVQRERLNASVLAVGSYASALAVDPTHIGARAGLMALLEDRIAEEADLTAAEALARAFKATDEWTKTLEILEHRVTFARDDETRTAILLEAADLEATRANDPAAALTSVCRAFPLAPSDGKIERELLRLAELTAGFTQAVEAYRRAITAAAADPARVASLRLQQGSILETQLADPAAALAAYAPVLAAFPDSLEAAEAIVRVASRTEHWDVAARALVESAQARLGVEYGLIATIEAIATELDAWDAATGAVASAVVRADALSPALARELETQVAMWHRDRRNDPDAAEFALVRAVAHEGADAPTLRMLAVLQRRAPGQELLATLLRLADVSGDDLGVLFEAAGVAIDDEKDLARGSEILRRLLRSANERWKKQHSLPTLPPTSMPRGASDVASGQLTAESLSSWALEKLVGIEVERKEHALAIELLVECSRLPFPVARAREMRRRAAEIAERDLGDAPAAITLYQGLLNEAGDDHAVIARLAALYRATERLPELVTLKRHELELTTDPEARLAIRLELASVLGAVGERDGRLEALQENLEERPGHEPSIDALYAMLDAERAHEKLANVLSEQALRLEASPPPTQTEPGQSGRSATMTAAPAALWAKVARIAELHLGDIERALESHRRVVTLDPTLDAYDALARLHGDRSEHATAVEWLERRLAATSGGDRAPTVVRLARELLTMGERPRALATLDAALTDAPTAREVRNLLATVHREDLAWESLASILTAGTEHEGDATARLGYLREAAEIYQRKLDSAERAIPLFEEAVRVAPTERGVRIALAEALRVMGRLDEAGTMLEQLIEEYGRRRPPERALVHVQLAHVAEAKGDLAGALAQLELSSSMDMGHVGTLRMLGATARRAGDLVRAERAYRQLLILVRRPAVAAEAGMGPSEVLFELYRIATEMQQPDRARETLESAFDAAAQNEGDALRLTQQLRAHGEHELLLRALQTRLQTVQDPAVVAEVLAEISEVSERLGRVDDAVDAVMKALDQMPSSAALHDAARSMAQRNGRTERYADFVEDLAERCLANGEPRDAGWLFVRLGELRKNDLHDLAGAAAAYERVEEHAPERALDAYRALDRIYSETSEPDKRAVVLRKWVQQAGEEDAAAKTEAIYSLAAIDLAREETREEAVDMLSWALDRDPQLDRAASMLGRVTDGPPRVLALFERAARALGDEPMLLDALERRAHQGDVSPDLLREGVDIANWLGDASRAEAILLRAVELARAGEAGLAEAVWALVALAERRKTASDYGSAVAFLREASDASDSGDAFQHGLEAASLAAGPGNDLRLAAELYEKLRQKDPADRNVWGPLLEVYRKLSDLARVETLIAETVESVFDANERNVLRVERARLLLSQSGRRDDAIAALKEVLDEDPEHQEAVLLLAEVLEQEGRSDELADLLSRQLDAARSRNDGSAIVALSLRLGGLLGAPRREEAMDVYRSASHAAPDDKAILRALVALFQDSDDANDRADTMERLLGLESGDDAATLALALVEVRASLDDEEGVMRALDRGFRQAPHNEALRTRLEKLHEARGDFGRLAEVIAFDGASRKDKKAAVARLREASKIHLEKLADAAAAADMLQRARTVAPEDVALLTDLAKLREQAGAPGAGITEITNFLEQTRVTDTVRGTLLRLRAELRLATNDAMGAVTDLEGAYAISAKAVAPDLAKALDRRRAEAAQQRDRESERIATMRLVEVLGAAADVSRAHDVLLEWIARSPDDRPALRALAAMDAAAKRWDGVIKAYQRLVAIERGQEQIDAALELAKAAESAGTPDQARAGLEQAFTAHPANVAVRVELRKIYTAIGAQEELAGLAMIEGEQADNDSERFDRWLEAGDLFLQAGNLSAAVAPLEHALQLKPAHHDATVLLADAYTVNGQIEEAMQLLTPAIDKHKGKRSREVAALMHRMARAANAGGGHDVELTWLQKALDADMQNGQVASELAEVAMELRHWDIALKALKAVTLLKVPGPMSKAMANLRQGMIAHQQGDAKRAVVLAKTALAQDPKLTEAADFLKSLGV